MIVDPKGKLVKVNEDGLAKIDGIPMFKIIERDNLFYVEFCDHDRMRSRCRGSRLVEIPLEILVEKVTMSMTTTKIKDENDPATSPTKPEELVK